MKSIDPKKIITYWKKTAAHDYEAMLALFKIKRYSEALFFGHIVLEKILKACVVQATGQHDPYTHDLVNLQKIANLDLSNNDIAFLDVMNDFNIRTRYPDYKLEIYQRCTKEYT